MIERDPNIVKSGLSRTVKKDGVTVEVSIIRLVHEIEWSLEVINSAATSIVWDELFATDEDAYAEFESSPTILTATSAPHGERTASGRVEPLPANKGRAAICAQRTTGVDVERT